MKFIIIDWMSNVCFDSDNQDFKDFDEASDELDNRLKDIYGFGCDLEAERQEYIIEEYNESNDRIMWTGNRNTLRKDYYKL